jgi:prepilin signal peptidase PulO-like enzyme (type II secretory pathway)
MLNDFSLILSLFMLVLAAGILLRLAIIDFKIRLLPNVWVGAFALTGIGFHALTQLEFITLQSAAIGILIGGGLLLAIRTAGNFYYKQDTLGLGDVKLMAAAGLWLGQDYILFALVCGAVAGLLHGLIMMTLSSVKHKKLEKASTFSLPAGPGFIVGIVIAALAKFGALDHLLF